MEYRCIISNKSELLENEIEKFRKDGYYVVCIETSFGKKLVEGDLTLDHHHPTKINDPCPCLYPNLDLGEKKEKIVICLSHMDLDTLGGIFSVLSKKDDKQKKFWEIAAQIDIKGPHKLQDILNKIQDKNKKEEIKKQMFAFWAYSQANRIVPKGIEDITPKINEYIDILNKILKNDNKLIEKGLRLKNETDKLNKESLKSVKKIGGTYVLLRESDRFVNHLYNYEGGIAHYIIGYNYIIGNITISKESKELPLDLAKVMQYIFGPKAGGHSYIAGSPRDLKIEEEEKDKYINQIKKFFEDVLPSYELWKIKKKIINEFAFAIAN